MNEWIDTLLNGYFHPDWNEEASEPSEVIDDFLKTTNLTSDELQLLANDIRQLAEQHEGEEEGWLLRELGCFFAPSGYGMTASEWLRDVAQELIAKAPAPHSG